MEDDGREESGGQSDHLRLELKLWEKNFETENGRKPDRADIKRNPEIGAQELLV
jgi:hypothetical protein